MLEPVCLRDRKHLIFGTNACQLDFCVTVGMLVLQHYKQGEPDECYL